MHHEVTIVSTSSIPGSVSCSPGVAEQAIPAVVLSTEAPSPISLLFWNTVLSHSSSATAHNALESRNTEGALFFMGSVLQKSSRENRPQLWEPGQNFPAKKSKNGGSWTLSRSARESSACAALRLPGKSWWEKRQRDVSFPSLPRVREKACLLKEVVRVGVAPATEVAWGHVSWLPKKPHSTSHFISECRPQKSHTSRKECS